MKKQILFLTALTSIVLSAAALPPPEKDEMELNEIKASRVALDGKIVETRISYLANVEQQKDGSYRAIAWLDAGYTTMYSEWMDFPAEAKDFVDELAEKSWGSSKTDIYVLVKKTGRMEAVGEKYKKSKGVYTW